MWWEWRLVRAMGGDRWRNEKTPALVRTGLWRTRYGALTLRKKEADQVAHPWDATQTRPSTQRLVTKSVTADCGHEAHRRALGGLSRCRRRSSWQVLHQAVPTRPQQ